MSPQVPPWWGQGQFVVPLSVKYGRSWLLTRRHPGALHNSHLFGNISVGSLTTLLPTEKEMVKDSSHCSIKIILLTSWKSLKILIKADKTILEHYLCTTLRLPFLLRFYKFLIKRVFHLLSKGGLKRRSG